MTLSFSNDDNGNAPLYYVAITLSSNAGSGFQQLVNWSPSTYSTYLNTDCQNHSWQDGAGNLLDSWFETPSATSSSTSVYEWVVLPNATATTIYLVFSATTASGYSTTHTGVQPNYSATYGQYDNGASVFPILYQNFAGTAVPTGWEALGTYTIDNGFSIGTAINAYIVSSSSFGADANQIFDAYITQLQSSSTLNMWLGYTGTLVSGDTYAAALGSGSGNAFMVNGGTITTITPSVGIMSIYNPSTTLAEYSTNYGTTTSATGTSAAAINVGVTVQNGGTPPTTPLKVGYIRIRTDP